MQQVLLTSKTKSLIAAYDFGRTSGGTVGIWQQDPTGSLIGTSAIHDYGGAPNTNGLDVTAAVLQKIRYNSNVAGEFTYTLAGALNNSDVLVELFFYSPNSVETDYRMNVQSQGINVLTNYDIQLSAGGQNKGDMRSFISKANSSGFVALRFMNVNIQTKVSGVKLWQIL